MKNNEAHVFQHKNTGLQMFVYHQPTENLARKELAQVILYVDEWIFLGMKTATCA